LLLVRGAVDRLKYAHVGILLRFEGECRPVRILDGGRIDVVADAVDDVHEVGVYVQTHRG